MLVCVQLDIEVLGLYSLLPSKFHVGIGQSKVFS